MRCEEEKEQERTNGLVNTFLPFPFLFSNLQTPKSNLILGSGDGSERSRHNSNLSPTAVRHLVSGGAGFVDVWRLRRPWKRTGHDLRLDMFPT